MLPRKIPHDMPESERARWRIIRRDTFQDVPGLLLSADVDIGGCTMREADGSAHGYNFGAEGIAIVARLLVLAVALAGSLAACTTAPTPPAQPTPASLQEANAELAAITADALTIWAVGDQSVRAACQAYLNEAAQRASAFGAAGAAIGTAGAGASVLWPPAGGIGALTQAFLTQFQNASGIPYTTDTSAEIIDALDAYEAGVNSSPPASVPQAVSYVDDLWFLCSPGGYAMLAAKAIASANVTPGTAAPISEEARARGAPAPNGRTKVLVNGK